MGRKKVQQDEASELLGDIKKSSKILDFKLNVKCKTPKQKDLIHSITDKEITFITGCAGTGKSYVSLYAALSLLKDGQYDKLILIYPVEVAEGEDIGYLKGTLEEKLAPWAEPDLYTLEKIITASGKNGKDIVKKLIEAGKIEIKTAGFLRGCTIDNSIVIVSESQNFGKDTFLKILTRIGEGSKYVFNGDEAQEDAISIKKGKKTRGLRYAIDHLRNLPEVGVVEFGLSDIVRNPVITKILESWNPANSQE
jgi:phosphate starvation-inducible PhoH-like protein